MSFDTSTPEYTMPPPEAHHASPEGRGERVCIKSLRRSLRSSKRRTDEFLATVRDEAFHAMLKSSPETYCYLIQAESGPVKIGVAGDPVARLFALQAAAYEELELLVILQGGVALERALHSEFRADHIRGEWFYPSTALYGRFHDLSQAAKLMGLRAELVKKEALDPRYVRRPFAGENTGRVFAPVPVAA